MNFVIEEWKEADLPEMLEIWNEVVERGSAFPQTDPLDIDSGKNFFRGQSFCGVLRDLETRRLQGLYILHPNNVGRCGHISNASYAIRENSKGKGLGRCLVLHSLKAARRLGFRIMQFNAVVEDNLAANKLYQSLGFIKAGSIAQGFKNLDGTYKDINIYYYDLTHADLD